MIFIGYSGIGKTTFCKKFKGNNIDLDTRYLMRLDNGDKHYDPETMTDVFVETALNLSENGFNVFVPLEKPIVKKITINRFNQQHISIILPQNDISTLKAWKQHLINIYLNDISEYNHISLYNTVNYYNEIDRLIYKTKDSHPAIEVYRFINIDDPIERTLDSISSWILYQIKKES